MNEEPTRYEPLGPDRAIISAIYPDPYLSLNEEQRKLAVAEQDICIIRHPEQVNNFLRAVYRQKIIGLNQYIEYGIWVSVSKTNLEKYIARFSELKTIIDRYPGYLCTKLPGYENTREIRMNLIVNLVGDDSIPEAVPQNDQMDQPFVRDYYNGITKEEADRRFGIMSSQIS